MRSYTRAVAAVALKDLRVERRSRETLVGSLIFALLVVVVFALALDLAPSATRAVAPGLLWATLAFAGVLSFGRLFAVEQDRGTLDGLLLAPIDPTALYVGKALAGLLLMLAVLVVALPAFAVLLGVPLLVPAVLPAALLGVVGFAASGTLFAALALSGRARDVLLPVLFLPLSVPVILAATGATVQALNGVPNGAALGVLTACDVLYIAASLLLFPFTIEE